MKSKNLAFVITAIAVAFAMTTSSVMAQEHTAEAVTTSTSSGENLAIGAALAIGLCALGAGYGIAQAGSAAMGAIAEKPESATWGLIIVALAEGVALYGLIIAFLLVTKI